MKITSTKSEVHGKEIIEYFINNILVARCKRYMEYYCTVDREGRPSNIRTKWKSAKETSWDYVGLREILGDINVNKEIGNRFRGDYIFKNDYPDLTWGYTGSILSTTKIKEAINNYRTKYL